MRKFTLCCYEEKQNDFFSHLGGMGTFEFCWRMFHSISAFAFSHTSLYACVECSNSLASWASRDQPMFLYSRRNGKPTMRMLRHKHSCLSQSLITSGFCAYLSVKTDALLFLSNVVSNPRFRFLPWQTVCKRRSSSLLPWSGRFGSPDHSNWFDHPNCQRADNDSSLELTHKLPYVDILDVQVVSMVG